MATRHRWRAPLRLRTYRALASTLTRSPHPLDAVEHLVGGRGGYPWVDSVRTPIGVVRVRVACARDAEEITHAFHRRDYGSSVPQVVVEVGSRAGVSTVYFLSRSPTTRVHVWEPEACHREALEDNVAPFAPRCAVHPAALATMPGAEPGTEGIGDALRGVLRVEDHIDLLKLDVAGIDEYLISAIPEDLLPDIREIVHTVPDGARHHRPVTAEHDEPWRLAG